MTAQTYASPRAFKQALEQRVKTAPNSGVDFARRRQDLDFDWFLAPAMAVFPDAALLKGGLALDLGSERARATQDIDLRLLSSPDSVLSSLRETGRLDLIVFTTFELAPDAEHSQMQNARMRYKSLRFRIECRLEGKIYGRSFGMDIAVGDPCRRDDTIAVSGPMVGAPRRAGDLCVVHAR